MKKWKIRISGLLALLLVMQTMVLGITAAEAAEAAEASETAQTKGNAVASFTVTYENPLYSDITSENNAPKTLASDGETAEDYYIISEEAAAELRAGMTERKETVEITTPIWMSEATNECATAVLWELVDLAVLHTGDPVEGDYLAWQRGTVGGSLTLYENANGGYDSYWTCTAEYYTTAEQEQTVDAAVNELLAALDLADADDYTAVKAVYDYICANITYDYEHLNDETYQLQYTAYGALINGTAVCQGYAVLFYRLALELGIDARLISGIGNGGGHAWNIVELDDLYYNLDSTWDAGDAVYKWFLLCDANFTDHTRDAECATEEFYATYPMGQTDYVYHVWDAGTVKTAVTCTEDGETVYTCSLCGETRTEVIPATGHEYDEGTVRQEATCTMPGEIAYVCQICDNTVTEEIPAAGHTETTVTTDPTCDTDGKISTICSVCGETISEKRLPATGHSYGDGEVVSDAACTADGVVRYTCGICGYSYTKKIPATGHTETESRREPTCEEPGTVVITCTVCGETVSEESLPATGHSYDDGVTEIAPTCTEAGMLRYTCSACGDSYTQSIPAAGHSYNDGVTETAPTCTEAGMLRYTCSACGHSYTESIPATGHTEAESRTEPTCTANGFVTVTCSVCHETLRTETLPAVGHKYENGVCIVCRAVEGQTFRITGDVTSYTTSDSADKTVTLTLLDENDETVTQCTLANGETAYSLEAEPGIYTLRAEKENHVPRTYDVTVGNTDVTLDVKICPVGDANMDGQVNGRDYKAVYDYLIKDTDLDEYHKLCMDVNSDKKVNGRDYASIYHHLAGSKLLW
ncbi:MAG: hypothetical protein IJ449_01240 [Clostridia bacterium]|nr:hypothetical protein [Clostridia bacterium]